MINAVQYTFIICLHGFELYMIVMMYQYLRKKKDQDEIQKARFERQLHNIKVKISKVLE